MQVIWFGTDRKGAEREGPRAEDNESDLMSSKRTRVDESEWACLMSEQSRFRALGSSRVTWRSAGKTRAGSVSS